MQVSPYFASDFLLPDFHAPVERRTAVETFPPLIAIISDCLRCTEQQSVPSKYRFVRCWL